MDEKKPCILQVYHYEVTKKVLDCKDCPFNWKCNFLKGAENENG